MRLVAVLLVSLLAGGSIAEAAAKPIYTNKTRFRIPYNSDPAEMQRLGAREIRLFGSFDRGVRWQPLQSVAPDAGRFDFQAPQDGEYWFSVRTVDRQERLHPSDPLIEPGLRVVVDTIEPRLTLDLRQVAPGRVQLSWSAVDENLDLTKFRLEFIQPGVPNWQVVSVIPKPADSTEWSVPEGGVVAVRGSIADLAGNVSQAQTQATIAPGPAGSGSRSVPNLREPVAERDVRQETASTATSVPLPSAAHYPREGDGTASLAAQMRSLPSFPATEGETPIIHPAPPNSSFVSHRRTDAATPAAPAADSTSRSEPERDLRVRHVNSRQFQIGYSIDDAGAAGGMGVVLFITEDDGKTWFRYGEDGDGKSPFEVQVPRAGRYGFTLLVKNAAGLVGTPPQSGERPAIVVVVDETPPQAQLLPLQPGQGAERDKVVIQWAMQDDGAEAGSVALYYAAHRAGPWQLIVQGLPPSGRYAWTPGASVPPQFFVRMEARDAAGNVQLAETSEPFANAATRPTARIEEIDVVPQ